MAGELTFPIRPASEVPVRRKPSFRVRRRAAADLPPHMVGKTLFEAYRTPLLQFVADWNRSPTKADMIEKAPSYEGPDLYLLPSIAAVVHALVDRHNMAVPDWVWNHRSEGQTEPLPRRKPSWVPALTPDGRQGAPTSGGVIGAAVPFGTIATMGSGSV